MLLGPSVAAVAFDGSTLVLFVLAGEYIVFLLAEEDRHPFADMDDQMVIGRVASALGKQDDVGVIGTHVRAFLKQMARTSSAG